MNAQHSSGTWLRIPKSQILQDLGDQDWMHYHKNAMM